jgi:hypothetical protein
MTTRSKTQVTVGRRGMKDLSNSTSDFTAYDVSFLNIKYEDNESIFDEVPNQEDQTHYDYLLLDNKRMDEWAMIDSTDDKKRKILSAIDYISSILEITDETVTNDFVSFLLSELQLNLRPFKLRHERKYVIHLPGANITSIPDMSIENKNTVLLVDEDKSLFNTDRLSNWGEHQIAGEVFTALYRNYAYGTNHPVYAIRVIGTFFTFYKAVAREDYLQAASNSEVIEDIDEKGRRSFHLYNELIIQRYPTNMLKLIQPSSNKQCVGLNYLDIEERKQIVFMLLSLKATLEKMHSSVL